MKIYVTSNLESRTNLDKILDENSLEDKLVRLKYKFAKLVFETSNKVYKFKTYNKTINNLINRNRWYKAID